MRRVLFDTGFPQSVPVADPIADPDDCLQILDLRNLAAENRSRTRFITLFVWTLGPASSADIYVQIGGQTSYFVGTLYSAIDSVSTAPSSMKLQIRGDVRVIARTGLVDACAIFGYFELEDTIPSTEIIRPLQASSPISPFTVAPLSLITSQSAILHAFEKSYIDMVSIDYQVVQIVGGVGVVSFTFPNGISLVTKEQAFSDGQFNMMSGIPMLTSLIGQTITVTADADIESAAASGTFIRA